MQHHVIRTETIEVTAPDEGAARRATEAVDEAAVLPVLDEVFEALTDEDEVVALDRVVVDVGRVAPADLGADLVDRLADELYEVLPPLIERARLERDVGPAGPATTGVPGALRSYAETGIMPWFAPSAVRADPDRALREYAASSRADARRLVQEVSRRALRRVVVQSTPETFGAVVGLLADGEPFIEVIEAWSRVVPGGPEVSTVARRLDPRVELLSLLRSRAVSAPAALLDELLALEPDPDGALSALVAAADANGLPTSVTAWLDDTTRSDDISRSGSGIRPAPRRGRARRRPSVDEPDETTAPHDDEEAPSRRVPPPVPGSPPPASDRDPNAGPERDGHPVPDSSRRPDAGVPEVPEVGDRGERMARDRSEPAIAEGTATRPHSDGVTPPTAADGGRRSDGPGTNDRPGTAADRVDEPEPAPRRPTVGEIAEHGVYVDNAGQVLLWPFLTSFFDRVGLLDSRRFRDSAAQERAVQLLHFAVTGSTECPEPALALNKLLCALPLDEPVGRSLAVIDDEEREIVELLTSVIAAWGVLGNTSVAGLRSTFLAREGRLAQQEMGWTLLVARVGVDVLVDRLPWGIGVVALPWMEEPLVVEW